MTYDERLKELVATDRLGKVEYVNSNDETKTITKLNDIIEFTIQDFIYADGSFIGSVISKKLDLKLLNEDNKYNSGTENLENNRLDVYTGITLSEVVGEGEEAETIYTDTYNHWGTFIVNTITNSETGNDCTIEAFDDIIKLNKEYIPFITFTETTTLYDMYVDICNQCGLLYSTDTFLNSDFIVSSNQYENKTCREVLSDICKVAVGFAKMVGGELKILTLGTSTYENEIDKNVEMTFKMSGTVIPINKISIGDSAVDGEEAVRLNQTNIDSTGISELVFNDIWFLNSIDLKESIIDSMFTILDGFSYTPFETEYFGFDTLESGDKITIKDLDDTSYVSYAFNHTFTFNGGFKGTLSTPALTNTEKTYTNINTTRDVLKKTEIRVDRAEQEIELLASDMDGLETSLTLTVNGLVASVSRSGGMNLLKNSSGQNNTNYWGVAVGNVYIESDTPPVDVYDTMLWYCTKTEGDYTEGILYMYDAYLEEWEDSGLTREQATEVFGTIKGVEVINSNNYDNDELREEYRAGSAFRLSVTDFYPEIIPPEMIANMICEPIDITEDTYNLSFKIKNNLTSGIARIGVNQYGEYLQNVENYSRYFLHSTKKMITPDENNGEYYTYNIQISKANIDNLLFGTISSTEPSTPEDNSYWLDTTDYETTFTAVLKQYDTTNEIWEEVDLSLLTEFENGTIYETNSIEFGDINTKEMWTYTSGSFLPCETTTDKYNAKQMVVTLVIFPELYMIVESGTEPEPSFGLYWVDTVNELIKRAKYVLTGEEYVFDSWITLDETYLFYSENLVINAEGNIIIGDLMLVDGNQEKDWTPAVDEVYGKRVKIDSSGLTVSTYENDNTMNITESEIVARKGEEKIFEISGYKTILKETEMQESLLMGKIITIIGENGTDEYYID